MTDRADQMADEACRGPWVSFYCERREHDNCTSPHCECRCHRPDEEDSDE